MDWRGTFSRIPFVILSRTGIALSKGPVLSVRDVSVVFGGIIALNGVSFDMKQGCSLSALM